MRFGRSAIRYKRTRRHERRGEHSLMRFGEDLLLIWRADEDFGRWEIDRVSRREIVLVSVDERGRWEHQTWSLGDGRMIE